jgi:hypothetical protein
MQNDDIRAAASRLVTFEKLAELYGVSVVHTVRGWRLHGKLPGLRKIGGRFRVNLGEFERATHPDEAPPQSGTKAALGWRLNS